MKTKNYIKLTGGIVGIHASKTITSLRIASDGGRETAFPTVVFYGLDNVEDFKVGDRVTIEGHVQLRIVRDEEGKTKYHQDCVGDTIQKAQRILAPFIEEESISQYDGGIQADENVALIFGTVRHVYAPKPNIAILSISIPRGEHRANVCDVTCFRRQADVAKMMQTGDCVLTAGTIQTKMDDNEGIRRTLQNIVGKDIVKIDSFEDVKEAALNQE